MSGRRCIPCDRGSSHFAACLCLAVTPPGYQTFNQNTTKCATGYYRADWKPRNQATNCLWCGNGVGAELTDRLKVYSSLADPTVITYEAITSSSDDCCECPQAGGRSLRVLHSVLLLSHACSSLCMLSCSRHVVLYCAVLYCCSHRAWSGSVLLHYHWTVARTQLQRQQLWCDQQDLRPDPIPLQGESPTTTQHGWVLGRSNQRMMPPRPSLPAICPGSAALLLSPDGD